MMTRNEMMTKTRIESWNLFFISCLYHKMKTGVIIIFKLNIFDIGMNRQTDRDGHVDDNSRDIL